MCWCASSQTGAYPISIRGISYRFLQCIRDFVCHRWGGVWLDCHVFFLLSQRQMLGCMVSDIGWTRMKGLIMCRVADFAPLRRQRVVQRRGRASCAPDWPSRTPGRGASGSEKLGKPWQPRKAMEHLWFFFGPFIYVYNIYIYSI